MKEEIKKCPFCGGNAIKVMSEDLHIFYVACDDCKAMTDVFFTNIEDAIEAWNRRVGE